METLVLQSHTQSLPESERARHALERWEGKDGEREASLADLASDAQTRTLALRSRLIQQCSYSVQRHHSAYFCANRNCREKVLVSWSQCSQLIPSVPACNEPSMSADGEQDASNALSISRAWILNEMVWYGSAAICDEVGQSVSCLLRNEMKSVNAPASTASSGRAPPASARTPT